MLDCALQLRSYNSVAAQLNLTPLEHRLVRFFNDLCIPLFTFGVNKRAEHVWRNELPRYFAGLDVVRHSVYLFACLNLWQFPDVRSVLTTDNVVLFGPDAAPSDLSFAHVFNTLAVLGGTDIFLLTASYFGNTLAGSRMHAGEIPDQPSGQDLDIMFFLCLIVFAFIGLHPHCVMPLLAPEQPMADLLGLAASLHTFFERRFDGFNWSHMHVVEGVGLGAVLRLRIHSQLVQELRRQLTDFHYANTPFAAISETLCTENAEIGASLDVLETCFAMSVEHGYPVPLFRFLIFVKPRFVALARAGNVFVLRMLFAYSCWCIFLGFHMLPDTNIWLDYILWFSTHFPLSNFDENLYRYVVVERHEVAHLRFRESLVDFDACGFMLTPADIVDVSTHL